MNSELKKIEDEIARIKAELLRIGEMRPGSLSAQPRSRGKLYWQLSYVHEGKGHTEYVQSRFKPLIEEQTENYRRFRELTRRWVDLALRHSKLKLTLLKAAKENGTDRGKGKGQP